jgi:hypothetical protein
MGSGMGTIVQYGERLWEQAQYQEHQSHRRSLQDAVMNGEALHDRTLLCYVTHQRPRGNPNMRDAVRYLHRLISKAVHTVTESPFDVQQTCRSHAADMDQDGRSLYSHVVRPCNSRVAVCPHAAALVLSDGRPPLLPTAIP